MTLKTCGCVQFFMLREISTRVCGSIDEKCIKNVEKQFEKTKISCDCKEACEKLEYEIEIHPSPMV